MLYLIYIIILLYVILILLYLVGWRRIKSSSYKNKFSPNISVIIACRNEEAHIEKLIRSLKSQEYSFKNTEFIFIDDHSEDATLKLLLEEEKTSDNIIVLRQQKEIYGKKG